MKYIKKPGRQLKQITREIYEDQIEFMKVITSDTGDKSSLIIRKALDQYWENYRRVQGLRKKGVPGVNTKPEWKEIDGKE